MNKSETVIFEDRAEQELELSRDGVAKISRALRGLLADVSVLSICSAPTQRLTLFDSITASTCTCVVAFSLAPELRRLEVTQGDIWTRPARKVLETQAELCEARWH